MSVYTLIYSDTADCDAAGSNAVYATARSATTATSGAATTATIGQSLSGGTYTVNQYFGRFDTSAVTAGSGTAYLSVNVTVAPGAATDTWEVRETPSLSNKIAGSTLGTYTLFGSVTQPIVTGRATVTIADITSLSRSSTLNLLISSQNERLNTSPSGVETNTISSADASGTTNDPYLQIPGSAGWQYVGVTAVVESAANNITLTEPTGVAQGDLMVACISYRSAAGGSVFTSPGAPWASVAQVKTDNTLTTTSAVASGAMFYCIRGASAPGLVFTRSAGANVALGRIVAYRNAAQSSTLDANNSGQTTAINTTSVSVTGLTTTQDDDLIVAMFAGGQESNVSSFAATNPSTASSSAQNVTAHPAPGIWVERCDSITVTGADTSLSVFDAVKSNTGATGNLVATAALGASHVVVAGAFKILVTAKTVTAAAGSFTLTGTTSTLTKGHPITADAGAYTLTGTTATLRRNLPLVAAAGTYALSGTTASLVHAWRLTAAAGAYSLTGTDASLSPGLRLTAGASSYALTGATASLFRNLPLVAGAATYALSGTAATLRQNIPVLVEDGDYTLSGVAATPAHRLELPVSSGLFELVGTDVLLQHLVTRTLSANSGTYFLTGDPGDLTRQFIITANDSVYDLSGQTAALTVRHSLPTDTGSYSVSGSAASLTRALPLLAGGGAYAIIGTAATLRRNIPMLGESAAYTLVGTAASLAHRITLSASGGAYELAGDDATPQHLVTKTLTANSGTYLLTGGSGELTRKLRIAANDNSYNLTGQSATPTARRYLPTAPGSYTLSGLTAELLHDTIPDSDAQADGTIFSIAVSLLPGSATVSTDFAVLHGHGFIPEHPRQDAQVPGVFFAINIQLFSGTANGEDNLTDDELLILLEAA